MSSNLSADLFRKAIKLHALGRVPVFTTVLAQETGFGIYIAKVKYDVALIHDGKYKHKAFGDNQGRLWHLPVGWLQQQGIHAHDCMEATDTYWEEFESDLVANLSRLVEHKP